MFKVFIKSNVLSIKKEGFSINVNFGKTGTTVSMNGNVSDEKETTFTKRVVNFFTSYTKQFPKVTVDQMYTVIEPLTSATSWRMMSNNLRRAFDVFSVDNKLTDRATYQQNFFYEGVMEDRTIHGANAPWKDGNTTTSVPKIGKTKKEVKEETFVDPADNPRTEAKERKVAEKKHPGKTGYDQYDANDPWIVTNRAIAKRMEE